MDRFFRLLVTGVIVVIVLVIGFKLMMRQGRKIPFATAPTAPAPSAAATPAPAASVAEDGCREAVVLTLESHPGVSAQMSVQDLNGQDQATQAASTEEGRFTTACYRPDNTDAGGDSSP